MPTGFHCLFDAGSAASEGIKVGQSLVDIVAVHDVNEDSAEAWVHPKSGLNWLRDLLPKDVHVGRVVTYGYDAAAASFFTDDAPQTVQRMAESLVQELRANRQFAGTLKRPIIFVCHGLGGLLVKKCLIYSSTRTAPKVVHLWDPFVSTFAILLFGTPHGRAKGSNWVALERLSAGHRGLIPYAGSLGRNTLKGDVQISQSIDNDFAPLMKQFHMFFFWEELPTALGNQSDFVVDPESAAPKVDNTETSGIHSTHSGMVKFGSRESSDYRTVIDALRRYSEKAPRIIEHRWSQAEAALIQLRAGEAWELGGFGFDVHLEQPFRHRDIPVHRHFYPPQATVSQYVGREAMLDMISASFLPKGSITDSPGRKSFVVFGMGGSGKTQLCCQFAATFKHQYAAIFTIHAATHDTIADSFCRIGQIADLEPTENAGRHYLSKISEPWLLIIDNADNRKLNLEDLFPTGDTAHILITTRCPDFRVHGSAGSLELNGLEKDEALHLLLTKADIPRPWDEETRDAGNSITKALGYLALAVVQAGNCIFRRICGLGEYLNLHSATRSTLHSRRSTAEGQDDQEDIITAVYSTFDVSLNMLMSTPRLRRQDASDLLNIICFFHFEHIPVELFARAVTNRVRVLETTVSTSPASEFVNSMLKRLEPPKLLPRFLQADHGKLDKYRINWAIGELQSLSLISFDGRSISLHPLVHAWAKDSLGVTEKKVWAALALNTLMESISLPPVGSSEKDGEFHRDILPHLDVCLSEHGSPISETISSMSSLRLKISKLFQPTTLLIMRDQVQSAAKCGWVFAERGLFDKASLQLRMVKHVLSQALGEGNDRTQAAMLALAGVYWGLGRLEEAIELQKTVVNERSRALGDENEATLQARDHLGRSYWLHGEYQKALDLQRETEELMRRTIGVDHPKYPDRLAAIDNYGVTLGSWRLFKESLKAHEEVYHARVRLFGATNLDTLSTRANLAMALLDLKRLEEAESHITEVYQQRRQQLGKEHPWTLWALCYLAKVCVETGQLDRAEQMLLEGIEAGIRSLAEDHLGVLMGQGELARVYTRQGRFDEATKLALRTISLIEKSRGEKHPDCVYGLMKLTHLYTRQGNRSRAIETCRLALQRVDIGITRSHPMGAELEQNMRVLNDPLASASDLQQIWSGTRPTRVEEHHQNLNNMTSGTVHKAAVVQVSRSPTW